MAASIPVGFIFTISMIISPNGEVLAEAVEAEDMAIADVEPKGGRENADWSNAQKDIRARSVPPMAVMAGLAFLFLPRAS